jgi:hypothetical protein
VAHVVSAVSCSRRSINCPPLGLHHYLNRSDALSFCGVLGELMLETYFGASMSGWPDLRLMVRSSELEPSKLADLTRNLRAELLGIDTEDVRPATVPAPAGAKAGETIAVGALVVSLTPVVVTAVIDVVASWLRRQPTDIEVEIDGSRLKGEVTRQQQDALVAAYLDRVKAESQQR